MQSKADIANALRATTEAITKAPEKGEEISLIGFETFKTNKRSERTGNNPRTGEAIKAASATVTVFKVVNAQKDRVNG